MSEMRKSSDSRELQLFQFQRTIHNYKDSVNTLIRHHTVTMFGLHDMNLD